MTLMRQSRPCCLSSLSLKRPAYKLLLLLPSILFLMQLFLQRLDRLRLLQFLSIFLSLKTSSKHRSHRWNGISSRCASNFQTSAGLVAPLPTDLLLTLTSHPQQLNHMKKEKKKKKKEKKEKKEKSIQNGRMNTNRDFNKK